MDDPAASPSKVNAPTAGVIRPASSEEIAAADPAGQAPPRLNPRLIQRRPMPPADEDAGNEIKFANDKGDGDDSSVGSLSTDNSEYSENEIESRRERNLERRERKEKEEKARADEERKKQRKMQTNPNAHMFHTGKYIKKEYILGRAVPLTGIWSCCGEVIEMSMYCKSLAARHDMIEAMSKRVEEERKRKEYKELKYANVKAPWDSRELGAAADREPTTEDKAMEYASSLESSFNAPMLMSWLYKNYREEPTVLTGMGYLLHHLEKGEGCALMLKHDAVGALNRIMQYYREHPPLQLQCVTALCRLLDCNYTRDDIIGESTQALNMAFSVAHLHMNSRAHVDTAARCIAQCCRSEVCRREIMRKKIYSYMLNFCKRFNNTASILRSCLKHFNWVATTLERMVKICEAGVIVMILKIMKKHITDADVVAPAMLFLTRAADQYPQAMETILNRKCVYLIIRALQALYSNEVLQLAGLKMLQTLSKTQEGWRQISETKGGWQSITQGTTIGDALVHDLPGALHNPGWAIGDTPHINIMDRIKILNAKAMQVRMGAAPKAAWTSHSLKDFMGVGVKATKLAVNNERDEMFFELLSTLELLPEGSGEDRVAWFQRIKRYEAENSIQLEEMCQTMIELKKSEALENKKKEALANLKAEEVSNGKETYVNGVRITTELLATTEKTLEEIMMRREQES